jgi:VIT1/CCC1 family predicted Fe2+/Mn2+ transporter
MDELWATITGEMPLVNSAADRYRLREFAARSFAIGLARAFGGALFLLPVLMTTEMWSLGASIDEFALARK